jgi:putative heme-binding domain-containing protein
VRAILERDGAPELARGREVFERTCQRCHTLFGTGGTLGPELTGANRSDREYLLSNVIDPSGVVANEYRTTIARLADGRLVTGVERGRTPSSVTLETETGRVTLALEDVDELELSPLSTMPEDQLVALQDDDLSALFAYLQSPVQTPLFATPANLTGFFDGKSLANWRGDSAVWSVEAGEIVGRTTGLERNAFLVSDYELGDFRLSLEVRLAGDQGNSGVQFRTRALDGGEVAGYQADVGPGWWGKLYEENGRGLLVDRDAAKVALDGWNRYVIECEGSRVRTWLNDEPCVDLDDPSGAHSGVVALQVHSGGPTEVRFRNLELALSP